MISISKNFLLKKLIKQINQIARVRSLNYKEILKNSVLASFPTLKKGSMLGIFKNRIYKLTKVEANFCFYNDSHVKVKLCLNCSPYERQIWQILSFYISIWIRENDFDDVLLIYHKVWAVKSTNNRFMKLKK